eukprot:scaffold284558_cov19-Prasinocladus_malaysianus.AAC.1
MMMTMMMMKCEQPKLEMNERPMRMIKNETNQAVKATNGLLDCAEASWRLMGGADWCQQERWPLTGIHRLLCPQTH